MLSAPSWSAADRDAPTTTVPSAFWWMPRAWTARRAALGERRPRPRSASVTGPPGTGGSQAVYSAS